MYIFKKIFTTSISLIKQKAGRQLVAAWGISLLLFAAPQAALAAEYYAGNYGEFAAVLANPNLTDGDAIVLTGDIVFTAPLSLPAGVKHLTIKNTQSNRYEMKGNNNDGMLKTDSGTDIILTLENVVFTEGNSTDGSGAMSGGAIYAENNITLAGEGTGNYFKNNQAEAYGGAVFAEKDITITSGANTFEANKATFEGMAMGGAIYSKQNVTITGGENTFSANEAGGSGGAIHSEQTVTITGGTNTFSFNKSTGGSAIYANNVRISGGENYFNNNQDIGGSTSGAIFAMQGVTISGGKNIFSDNTGTGIRAAKVEIINGETTIKKSKFSAIAGAEIIISGGTNNFIANQSAQGQSGGALTSSSKVEITGGKNTFEDNKTSNEGGGISVSGLVSIADGENTFKNNEADLGGAISVTGNFNPASVEITGGTNTFENNTAASYGGAINGGTLFGDNVIVLKGGTNLFKGNVAKSGGGAIVASTENKITIAGGTNTFENNRAVDNASGEQTTGGALAAGEVEISGGINVFNVNWAESDKAFGGAIATEKAVKISGGQNTFVGNEASGQSRAEGGAINTEDNVTISGGETLFENNTAHASTGVDSQGGAIYAGTLTLTGGSRTEFLNNQATVGSAVYIVSAFQMNSDNSPNGKTQLAGNGEFAASTFYFKDAVIAPIGDMTFNVIFGNNPIILENMTLQGDADGSLAASGGYEMQIKGEFTANIEDGVQTALGGKITADPGQPDSKLVKNGLGELRIIGNEHTYNAYVNGGSFMLGESGGEGKLTGNVDISGAKLGGNGTIEGNVAINNGGILSPGNSIGQIKINNGNLTLYMGSIVEIEVDPANPGDSDKITVINGEATLEDGVSFKISGYKFDEDFEFLTADTINGGNKQYSFADNTLLVVETENTGTSLSLTVQKDPGALLNLAQTANQKAVAAMAMTDTNDAVYLIFNNPNDAARLLTLTSGEIHASTRTALTESTRHIRDAVFSRMGEAGGDNNVWAQMVGSWDSYDGNNVSKMKTKTRGVIAGFDKNNGSRRTGIAFGVTKNENKIDALSSSSDANSTHLALYIGSADYSKSYQTRFGAGMSWHSVDSSRNIILSNEHLSADYSAQTFQLFGEIGKRQARGNKGYLEPFLGIAYASTNANGFSERSSNGAGGALTVDGKTYNSTYSNLGIRFLSKASGGKTTFKAAASWQHLLGGSEFKTTHRLLAGATPFEIAGAPIAKDALVLDLGFEYKASPNFSWGVNYNGHIAKQMHNDALKINFSWKY